MPRERHVTRYAFPETHWTLVDRAGHAEAQVKAQALGELLRAYMPALKSHLVVRMRLAEDKAEDLLQTFLLRKVLEQDLIPRTQRGKGRFRTFLLTSLDRFVFNQLRDEKAGVRSPGQIASLDYQGGGGGDEDRGAVDVADDGQSGPAAAFEEAWVRSLLAEVLRRMRQECDDTGRPDIWGVFEARVLAPAFEGADPVAYGELAKRLRLTSEVQAANLLVTAKRMFARVLRGAVGEYEKDETQIDAEISDLQRVLAGGAA